MTRAGRFTSTTAFKLSAIYLTVFSVFAVVFAVSITLAANQLLDQQLNDSIEAELLQLADEWNNNGITVGLIAAINERGRRPDASLYLLADYTGEILAGNVREVKTDLLAQATMEPTAIGYRTMEGEDRVAIMQAVRLPGGMLLLVGRDIAERERFADVIRYALVIAAVLLIGLAAVSWFFVSRRVLKRIDSVSATTRRIMAGDLTGRLEVTGTNDEFDRLASSLNDMLERIEMLLQGLKDVSDNIAHDLKTPLTRIRNRIEGVLADGPNVDKQRDVLRATIEDADQLIGTFDALLTIARLESGAAEGTVDDIDAVEIARDVMELYEPVAEDAGVRLRFDGDDRAMVRGNRELLSQALANLLDNAIKHGRPEASDGRMPEVSIKVRRSSDEVVLSIADNGAGVPQSERGRVVERFVRLEASRSTPGTGLGLSLAAAAAKLAHGSLELGDAEPGLIVKLRLPAVV
ncbi:MAG: ATP-binding protein [Alphaproteobacteria bacterium]